jgi:hypothetical protein
MSLDFTESEWEIFISTIDFDSIPAPPDLELDLSMPFDPLGQVDTTPPHSTSSEFSYPTALVPRVRQEEIELQPVEMRKR